MNNALIIVDLQNDFLEKGALAIKNSSKIIPGINKLVVSVKKNNWLVIETMDSHPLDHVSFKTTGGNWPVHCVSESFGAQITKKLINGDFLIKKGTNSKEDSYSAFFNGKNKYPTELKNILKNNKIKNVYICGLALDYCVMQTALDAKKNKFNTFVIIDLSVPISNDVVKIYNEFRKHKIKLISSSEIEF